LSINNQKTFKTSLIICIISAMKFSLHASVIFNWIFLMFINFLLETFQFNDKFVYFGASFMNNFCIVNLINLSLLCTIQNYTKTIIYVSV
jgi:hypothetical protein